MLTHLHLGESSMSELGQQPQATSTTITELDQFAHLLVNWHSHSISQIDHLANTPETETLQVMDNDTGEVTQLTGTEREAFIKGLLVAKTMLMQLPFTTQAEAPVDEA